MISALRAPTHVQWGPLQSHLLFFKPWNVIHWQWGRQHISNHPDTSSHNQPHSPAGWGRVAIFVVSIETPLAGDQTNLGVTEQTIRWCDQPDFQVQFFPGLRRLLGYLQKKWAQGHQPTMALWASYSSHTLPGPSPGWVVKASYFIYFYRLWCPESESGRWRLLAFPEFLKLWFSEHLCPNTASRSGVLRSGGEVVGRVCSGKGASFSLYQFYV